MRVLAGAKRLGTPPALRRSLSESSLGRPRDEELRRHCPALRGPEERSGSSMRYSLYHSPHLLLLQGYSQQHVSTAQRSPPRQPFFCFLLLLEPMGMGSFVHGRCFLRGRRGWGERASLGKRVCVGLGCAICPARLRCRLGMWLQGWRRDAPEKPPSSVPAPVQCRAGSAGWCRALPRPRLAASLLVNAMRRGTRQSVWEPPLPCPAGTGRTGKDWDGCFG